MGEIAKPGASRATELLNRLGGVRMESTPSRIATRVAAPKMDGRKASDRKIKYPNDTNALRVHVASVDTRPALPTKPHYIAASELQEARTHKPINLAGPSSAARALLVSVLGATTRRNAEAPHVSADTTGDQVDTPSDIGRLVRARREALGLNQQAFAAMAGVGRRFVSELETGKPTVEFGRVLRVCRAAGIRLTASVENGR